MSSLSHEQRILRMCRSIFAGRNVTPKWAAECCGLTEEEFLVHYDAYIRRLTRTIETGQEWFLLAELEYLLRAKYLRPKEASLRFRAPQANIEEWLKEKEETGEDVDWNKMRIAKAKQLQQEKIDAEMAEKSL